MSSMPDWVAHRSRAIPETVALISDEGALNYRELGVRTLAFARALVTLGARESDRVALVAGNSLAFGIAVHGVACAGAILVPINVRLSPPEVAAQLARVQPRIVLTDADNAPLARAACEQAGLAAPVALPTVASGVGTSELATVHEQDDPFCIIHTSGTTGRARGAVLTYGNFWASAAGSAFNLGVVPGDRWLACMPLFHVGGLSILLRSAIYGTTAVVHHGFDAARVSEAIHEQGITLLSVVATMLQRVLEIDPRPAPGHLRAVLVGGGPVPPALLEQSLDRGFPVVQTYGLTETASQVTTLAPADARSRLGFAGQPLSTSRVRVDAPAGEPGEILVAGPTVMAGYYNDPQATAEAIRDGWLHTGDIGVFNEEGFLKVLDRRDDLIVSGGENVYPAEVEAALLSHPAIIAAAVVGQPDRDWGQVVCAAVIAADDVRPDELTAWLRGWLAGFKIPRRILRVAELPTTASGKVQRHIVRRWFEPPR